MKQDIFRFYLKQHIGKPSEPCVKQGDFVKKGSLLAHAADGLSLNLHTGITGVVSAVTEEFIAIKSQESSSDKYEELQSTEALELIKESGLCGMGGAGFPTYVKLMTDLSANGTVIINSAECEPILNHNIQRIMTSPKEIIKGLQISMELTKATHGIIAIKEKNQDAIQHLTQYLEKGMEIALLPDLYPMGEERAVIREVTGVLLDVESLPSAANTVVMNLETVYRIYEAVVLKKPVITKDLTVGGLIKKGTQVFLDVPIGTNLSVLLEECGGISEDTGEVIIGGPFTGKRAPAEEYITKTTGGILAAMPFLKDTRKMGLLVCACGGNEERLRQIADSMEATVVGVEFCKQAHLVKGNLKCDNPGKCPGQSQKVLSLRKQGAETLLISNCTDCTNTVLSITPQLKMPVYHCTDGALRAAGKKIIRKHS